MKHPTFPVFSIFTHVFLLLLLPCFASASPANSLSRGSSLSVEDESPVIVSPDGSFSCCFHKIGSNAYTFSIWFSKSADNTTAWTANRDRPVNAHGSSIMFSKDGRVVLADFDGEIVWSTSTSSTGANQIKLLDTGNLVVVDADGKTVLWQSFDSPTDTLLPDNTVVNCQQHNWIYQQHTYDQLAMERHKPKFGLLLCLRSFNRTSVLNKYIPIDAMYAEFLASLGDNPSTVISTCFKLIMSNRVSLS